MEYLEFIMLCQTLLIKVIKVYCHYLKRGRPKTIPLFYENLWFLLKAVPLAARLLYQYMAKTLLSMLLP